MQQQDHRPILRPGFPIENLQPAHRCGAVVHGSGSISAGLAAPARASPAAQANMIERLEKLIEKLLQGGQPTNGWLNVVDAKRHRPATRKMQRRIY